MLRAREPDPPSPVFARRSDGAMSKDDNEEPRIVDAAFAAAATDVRKLIPADLPEVAFAGRSNVGKSSLLNGLMQRRNLVRTSRTPGCTRQVNIFRARWADGWEAHLVDLPGYGYAKRSRDERASWGPMLEGYLLDRAGLSALAVLVDVRRGPEDDDLELVEFVRTRKASPVRVVAVATKLDKLPRSQQKPALEIVKRRFGALGRGEGEASEPVRVIGFSAVTGDGRTALWQALRSAIV